MILTEICKNIESGQIEEFVTEAGIIKRIREKINTHNWKKKVKKYDFDAMTEKRIKYTVRKVDSRSGFNVIYNNNDLCIEECGEPLEEFYQILANSCYTWYNVSEPVRFCFTTGKIMNKVFDLAGTNAYPDDLIITFIPLKYFKGIRNTIDAKSRFSARYFNDVVDNNEYREVEAGRHEPSDQIQWLVDYHEGN